MKRIKVEKGIPLPQARQSYPWEELDVGDSFLFKCSKEDTAYANVRSSACVNARRTGRKYATRYDNKAKGIRVWRLQ